MPNVVNEAFTINAASGAADGPPADGGDGAALDLPFLDAQTFGDRALRREVLGLFVAQARRVIPGLPALPPAAQGDAAHLLKGSARAIGAWAAAAAATAFEAGSPEERVALLPRLERAFASVAAAIAATDEGAA